MRGAWLVALAVLVQTIVACGGARPVSTMHALPEDAVAVQGTWHLRRGPDARAYLYLSLVNLSRSRIEGTTLEVPGFQDFRPVDLDPGEVRIFPLGVFAPRCAVPMAARLTKGVDARETYPVLGLRVDLAALPQGVETACAWPAPATRTPGGQ